MASEQQKLSMSETLLEQEQPLIQPAPEGHEHDGAGPSPLTTILGFVFLSFSSAMAVSSWHRGYGAVSFVVFSYLDLAMLFYCLRQYERTPPRSPRRELLKMAMWLLGTMHVLSFFELLEFCFQTSIGTATENSITDFQSNTTTTCPHQHPMLPDGGC